MSHKYISTKIVCKKCWRNQPGRSLTPFCSTFCQRNEMRLCVNFTNILRATFCTKVKRKLFCVIGKVYSFFKCKEIGAKAAHKMLVQLKFIERKEIVAKK